MATLRGAAQAGPWRNRGDPCRARKAARPARLLSCPPDWIVSPSPLRLAGARGHSVPAMQDASTLRPHHVIIAGLIMAAIFVIVLIVVVNLIVRAAG